jgi:hypothetical protein
VIWIQSAFVTILRGANGVFNSDRMNRGLSLANGGPQPGNAGLDQEDCGQQPAIRGKADVWEIQTK